jgi:putative SOS response-associated peptidase YedK
MSGSGWNRIGVTNVRKLNLPHWRRWFGVEHRRIVPVTSFAEPDPASAGPDGRAPGLPREIANR